MKSTKQWKHSGHLVIFYSELILQLQNLSLAINRGGYRNLRRGEHAKKFRVTTPTFAKPRPFQLKLFLNDESWWQLYMNGTSTSTRVG